MKFLMENKKKQFIYIAIILVSLGAMGWVWFGGGISPGFGEEAAPSNETPLIEAGPTYDASILPFGVSADTTIFSSKKFLELVPPPEVFVTEQEIGRYNPFLSVTSTQP